MSPSLYSVMLEGRTNGRENVLICTCANPSLPLSFLDISLMRDLGYRNEPMDMKIDRPSPKYPTVGSIDAGSAAEAWSAGVKSSTYQDQ